ncbi:MAG: lysophospholipid acyltransferase family protein [Desulfobacteraceae bacterium]|nr:lysophospholipid acyltransferase family protein [Desulfobacteraceae bacterium]
MTPKKQWDSKSMGSRMGHYFFYLMIRLGGRRFARPIAYFFLYFVVFYYASFFTSVKRKCAPYLGRQFPKDGPFKQFIHRYRLVLNLGKVLIDRAIFGILGPDTFHASFENQEELETLLSLDSGFIILMAHVGCWQLAMSALSRLNKPVNLLMLQDKQNIDKHYYEHGTSGKKFKIINPDQFLGGSIEMLNVLKKDEVLCIMGDRIFGNTALSLQMDFLRGKALFPTGAYKLASISQKPVVILHSYKSGPDSYKIMLSRIIQIPPKLGKANKKVSPFAKTFVQSMEAYIRRHPYQFFNFYDMWEPEESLETFD